MQGWVINVMVHESIYDDKNEAHAWFQSLALTRLYEQYGRAVPATEILPKLGGPSANGGAPQ